MVALGIVKEWAVFDVLWKFFTGKYTLDLSLCHFYPGKSAKKFIR